MLAIALAYARTPIWSLPSERSCKNELQSEFTSKFDFDKDSDKCFISGYQR
jgi:hypothetical protein